MSTDPMVVSLRKHRPDVDPGSHSDDQDNNKERGPVNRRKHKRFKLVALIFVVLIVLGVGAYVLTTQVNIVDLSNSYNRGAAAEDGVADVVGDEEISSLIEQIGLLIALPEDEVPTVATVSDPEKLQDQLFFARAKEGDKVLLYTGAQKAYLYDPVAHKLLEVAPITTEIQ